MKVLKVFNEVLGTEVAIPEEPNRIVSLAPSITDTLYRINAWDKVIGVSYFCLKPPIAREKPKVGSYFNVNYKLLEELKPDLILVTTGAQRRLGLELIKKGYNVYAVPVPISLYGILENVNSIGLVTNHMEEARKLSLNLLNKIAELSRSKLNATVYYEVDLGEPITVGSATYIDHALSIIGLRNIFSNLRKGYFTPPFNEVIDKDPDIIIYEPKPFSKVDAEKIHGIITKRRGWTNLRAIRENRLVVIEPDSLAHYGPTLIEILWELREKLAGFLTK